jgi:hypothetical protein
MKTARAGHDVHDAQQTTARAGNGREGAPAA